jgi:hypothetical protein
VELENLFYEAEDYIRSDQDQAISLFDQVIAREQELYPNREDRKQSFQSLKVVPSRHIFYFSLAQYSTQASKETIRDRENQGPSGPASTVVPISISERR